MQTAADTCYKFDMAVVQQMLQQASPGCHSKSQQRRQSYQLYSVADQPKFTQHIQVVWPVSKRFSYARQCQARIVYNFGILRSKSTNTSQS